MKRIFIIGLILILLIVGFSFFINNPIKMDNDVNASQQSVEYTENGITLSMPGDWVSAKSKSNESVLAVADPNSKDPSGFNNINVNIEKKNSTRPLESEFKSNYNTLARNSDFNILFEGNSTFNGEDALEVGIVIDFGILIVVKESQFSKHKYPKSSTPFPKSTFDNFVQL